MNINEQEKKIVDFWEENDIFEKSLKKESPKGEYVFYDGPPFATGTPHYGHIVASTMKDVIPRYYTMKGYYVERKWGWDCHGLPIENIVEKELGFKSKKDIENLGISQFNNACNSKVLTYVEEWKKTIKRLGRWVDMENAYKTMDNSYMESVWWAFKSLWDKGLIYEGYKSMHVCPRCETTLSQQEVTEGYKDIKDLSVIAEFKLEDKVSVLAWTTTPWTLPGNVALAVGEDIDYVEIEKKDEGEGDLVKFILAKAKLEDVFKDQEYKIVREFKGKDLVGRKYKPLFPYYLNEDLENKENLYTIVSADFVSTQDGTGIVHIAPAYGEDDMNLGKEKNLAFIQNVFPDGHFKSEVTDFSGLSVKPKGDPKETDKKIVEYLKEKDLLFEDKEYEHSYPHCWRCDTPLINYATSSWFVKVTAVKERALELAKNINWFPSHIKEGRFGKWLEGARDWAISRQRFWASVMPVWRCDCGEIMVFGSVAELEKASGQKVEDLHKHTMDEIKVPCSKCDKEVSRIPDVLDCWFDSGAMPYAQEHYPFENSQKFESNFPAQFIAEGSDQTRAWFYYLHVLATALMDKPAFKNVIVNGIVATESGKKMSKKLQNYTAPEIIMEKYGSDALRLYLLSSPVMGAENLSFSDDGVKEMYQKVIMLLSNVLNFYKQYEEGGIDDDFSSENVLDLWLRARLDLLSKEVSENLDKYDLARSTRPLISFVNEFSTWWLRLSRPRFKSDDKKDALRTFRFVLLNLSKLMAPFAPFISEHVYKEIGGKKESVHLEDWPNQIMDSKDKANDVLKKMEVTRKAVEIGLALRNEEGIKVRQPLSKLFLKEKEMVENIYLDLVKQELNIKDVSHGEENKLDTNLTPELKQEGLLREMIREINKVRKEMGLSIDDKEMILQYSTKSENLESVFSKFEEEIKQGCLCLKIEKADKLEEGKDLVIEGEEIKLRLIKD